MIKVDTSSFLVITAVAALAAVAFSVIPRPFAPPMVVLELFLGILVGPQVLGLGDNDAFTGFYGAHPPRPRTRPRRGSHRPLPAFFH